MLKLFKWVYALGKKHALDQFEAELRLYFAREPQRVFHDEFDMKETDKHFEQRLAGWFAAREAIDAFFYDKRMDDQKDL